MFAVRLLRLAASRQTKKPMVWAVCISVAFHLAVGGLYELGRHYHLWEKDLMPAWLRKVAMIPKPPDRVEELAPRNPQEPVLTFVDVDPAKATTEAPENTKYYAAQNTKAANPDARKDTDTPKIDGSQTHVTKTTTVTQSAPKPKTLPPAPKEPPKEEQEAEVKPKPKGGLHPGDLALAKPADHPGEGKAEDSHGEADKPVHKRPRTLAEARQLAGLVGPKMHQEGGAAHVEADASFSAKGTPFGEYDQAIVYLIQNRWYKLLDETHFARDRRGSVVLEFRLHYDGRITDMKIVENTVDDFLAYLCQRAILDQSPYDKWPTEMRRIFGADYREVRFTFFYE